MENSIKLYKSRTEIPNGFAGKLICIQFGFQKIYHIENFNSLKRYLTAQTQYIEYPYGGCEAEP